MFKEILENLKSLIPQRKIFDPGIFNDPVAMTTQWCPAKGGGASFKTHKLVMIDNSRLEFKASAGLYAFCGIFFCVGCLVMILGIAGAFDKPKGPGAFLVPLIFGGVFATIGFLMFYFFAAPIVFDKISGEFWKGRKKPSEVFDKSTLKNYVELKKIHALQIIAERCSSKNGSYFSYELNLVLHDGNRLNVVDHGNAKKLREDAKTLATFLNVPVWDATM